MKDKKTFTSFEDLGKAMNMGKPQSGRGGGNPHTGNRGNPGRGGPQQDRPSGASPAINALKQLLTGGFYAEKEGRRVIKTGLLTDCAENLGKAFERDRLSSSQLRRFFGEVRSLQDRVRALRFEPSEPLIRMLKSKVAYACPKGGRDKKVPDVFKDYIDTMVDHVKNEDDFEAFVLSFEAVVGYFYGEGGGRNR